MGAGLSCRGVQGPRGEGPGGRWVGGRSTFYLVSSPPNITYLTGYDMVWYYLTSPVSVAVHAESGQTVFFEVPYHQPTVEWHAVVDDAEYFGDGQSPAEQIVNFLKGRGWLKGNVGVEDWSRAPSGVVINEIKQGFADAGANVVEGSWIVDRVRLIKSAPEIEVMRKAASIADKAMETVRGSIRPGVTETELAGVALHAMMKEGGGRPGHPRCGEVGAEVCGSALGAEPSEAAAGRPGLDQSLRVLSSVSRRPGSALLAGRAFAEVARADGQDLRERRSRDFEGRSDRATPQQWLRKPWTSTRTRWGCGPNVAYVSGYNMGIAIPPDWVGHTFIDPDTGFETARYDPGDDHELRKPVHGSRCRPRLEGGHGRRLHRDDPHDRHGPRDSFKVGQERDGYRVGRGGWGDPAPDPSRGLGMTQWGWGIGGIRSGGKSACLTRERLVV